MDPYPDLFNDVFGPIMQPGSSSHTAGPCRLGFLARSLLGDAPSRIDILLDAGGSFAGTFGVMGEDSAMVAGALGMLPDDPRLFDAQTIARDAGIEVTIRFGHLPESEHPNAVRFTLARRDGRMVTLTGDSTGGGMVETRSVDGFALRVVGDDHVVLLRDATQGDLEILAAGLAAVVECGLVAPVHDAAEAGAGVDVGTAPVHGLLGFVACAEPPDLAAVQALMPGRGIDVLAPVLPVLRGPERGPRLFGTVTRWRELAEEWDVPLWEVALRYEVAASGWSRERVLEQMRLVAAAMRRQNRAVYEEDLEIPVTPFRPNLAEGWHRHLSSPRRVTDGVLAATITGAYGAGAGVPGVETVPGPMGSGGGYVYAALSAVKDAHGFSDDDLLRGLFVAGGVGLVAFCRTEPTGEVIGCAGECGVCGAMAAAGVAEMAGGSAAEVENAASLALQATLGMPCDPIPGGKGQPCRSRVLSAACMAPAFADIALAGHDAVLPFHEVLDAADAIGRSLPSELLCTSRGGAAAAPRARDRARAYAAWLQESSRTGAGRPPGNLI